MTGFSHGEEFTVEIASHTNPRDSIGPSQDKEYAPASHATPSDMTGFASDKELVVENDPGNHREPMVSSADSECFPKIIVS
jgi:hypothetical protein